MTLQAFETLMLHIDPDQDVEPALLGVRHHEAGRSGKRVSFDVYARPGRTIEPLISAPHPPRVAWLGGMEVPIVRTMDGWRLKLALDDDEAACRVEGGRLEAVPSDTAWRISGECIVRVPVGTQANIHVLCGAHDAAGERVACDARVNGWPIEVRVIEPPDRGPWTWLEISLPGGRNEVSLEMMSAAAGGTFQGSVGWWLWAEYSLKKETLTVEFDGPLPRAPSGPRPLPLNMETERCIITIQSPRDFNLGHP